MMIYKTRYVARKMAKSGDIVVKVKDRYIIIPAWEYEVWKILLKGKVDV